MIDHIGVPVHDLPTAASFYDSILTPLGYAQTYADADVVGFGSGDHTYFWLHGSDRKRAGTHVAFEAPSHDAVAAFHAAGLAAGGHDNGGPGLRTDYSPTYFAAFLIDADGHNVEAVCQTEPD